MSKKRLRRQRLATRRAARSRRHRGRIVSIALVLLLLGAATSLVAAPADVFESPGAIAEGKAPDALEIGAGDGTVSGQTGAYQHSISIAVPPGRGVEPSLTLSYSSQQPLHGGLAAGFTLAGLPTISRDWSRGQYAPERWTSSMAGRELVETTTHEPQIAGWRSFRAQSDTSQARYQLIPQQLPPALVWRVLQTDGEVLHFGEPQFMGGTTFSDWMPITRRVDPFGNEVHYHWEPISHGGQVVGLRPQRIEYAINDNVLSGAPHARVIFGWAAPDLCGTESFPVGAQVSYRSGARRITGYARLETITTQVATDTLGGFRDVREYSLGYDAPALSCAASDRAHDGPMRLLTTVDERARAGDGSWTSMPTIELGYGPAVTASTTGSVTGLPSGIYPLPHGEGGYASTLTPLGHAPESLLQDVAGDGRPDLLYAVPSPSPATDPFCYLGWKRNLGRNGNAIEFGPETTIRMPIFPWANHVIGASGSAVANFGTMGVGESCTLVGQHTLESDPYEDNETYGSNPPQNYIGAILIYSFRDVNGDGLLDLVTALEHDPSYFSAEPGDFLGCTTPGAQDDGRGPIDIEQTTQFPDPPGGAPPAANPLVPYNACDGFPYPGAQYPLNVYLGDGGGGFGTQDDPIDGPEPNQRVRSPIPLHKQVGESYPILDTTTGVRSQPDAMIDMDGDGWLDFVHVRGNTSGWELNVHRWDGAAEDPGPRIFWIDDGFRARPVQTGSYALDGTGPSDRNNELATLIDIDGDGLLDAVDRDPFESGYRVLTNRGSDATGGFSAGPQTPFLYTSVTDLSNTTIIDRVQLEGFRDIDGDGRVDRFDPSGYHFSGGEGWVAGAAINPAAGQVAEIGTSSWQVTKDRIDLDGDGVADAVTRDGSSIDIELAEVGGTPRGVLQSIDNGRGLTVDIVYAPHTDPTVVTMDIEDRLPSPTWVVAEITATHAHAAASFSPPAPATTEYRYDHPVWNQDQDDRWGFRGFKSVTTTGPSQARTEERFDYELDWSGRQIASLVYPKDSANPATIDDTTWQSVTLFGGLVWSFFSESTSQRKCEYLDSGTGLPAVYDEGTCRLQVEPRLSETIIEAYPDTGTPFGHVEVAEHDGEEDDGLFPRRIGFFKEHSYEHLYGANVYRLVRTRTRSSHGTAVYTTGVTGVTQWFYPSASGVVEHDYDSTLRVVDHTCQARSSADLDGPTVDPTSAACTAYTYDPDTGLKVSEQRPEQFPSGLTTSFEYSGASFPSDGKWPFPEASFKVFPVTVENELGHQVHTHTDLGTGAVLATYGPNDNEGSYQILDGFGRALETWISTDVAGPGDPYLWLRTWIFEYQDLASPQQKIERSSRNPKDEAFYTTSYTDTYWTERRTVYDGAGRVIEMIDWRITASVPKTTRRFVYDAAGNLDFATVPDPTTNNDAVRVTYDFSHDSLGRRTCATAPDDTGVATVFGGDTTVVTELVPDGLDGGTCANPESSTMEPHARRTVTVDLFDRVVEVREKVTDTTDAVTTYDYDANSNVARIEREDTGGDIVTAMTHDWVGNRTSIVRDPDGAARTWLYNYDRDGELESQSAPMDDFGTHTTTYIRDPLGRVDSKMVGTGSLSPAEEDELAVGATGFDYDQGANGIGRLTSVTLPFGSISMVYDAWGNLTDETRTIDLSNALGVTFTDSLTRHADTFTSDGKPMHVIEASDLKTQYGYFYFGWLPFQASAWHDETDLYNSYRSTFTQGRHAAGLVGGLVHYLRTPTSASGQLLTGRQVIYARDQNGRVWYEYSANPGADSDDWIRQHYFFYGAGEVSALKSRVGASSDDRNYTFGYDHQHQLTIAGDDKGYSALFTYSPQGRLQTADIEATVGPETLVWPRTVDYAYDSTDPEAVGRLDNASDPGRFAAFTHDANGNLTERVLDPDGSPETFKLTYDAEDRLRVRELPDGKRELYYYHDNARWLAVKKDSVGTVLSARLWFGNAEIQYTCAAGTCSRSKTRTTLRIAGEAVARFDKDVATGVRTQRLLHSNRLGHLLGVYSFQDPTGALDYNLDVGYQYGPFGEILEVKEFPGATTSAEDYTERFNGKELDEASGLSYYGYRYYDPLSLTWNRSDPLYRFAPENAHVAPRRGGLYSFNLNNGVRNIDLDGLDVTVNVFVAEHSSMRAARTAVNASINRLRRESGTNVRVTAVFSRIANNRGLRGARATPPQGIDLYIGAPRARAQMQGELVRRGDQPAADDLTAPNGNFVRNDRGGLSWVPQRGTSRSSTGLAAIVSDNMSVGSENSAGAQDQLQGIVTHELGHVLGLPGGENHHPDPNNFNHETTPNFSNGTFDDAQRQVLEQGFETIDQGAFVQ